MRRIFCGSQNSWSSAWLHAQSLIESVNVLFDWLLICKKTIVPFLQLILMKKGGQIIYSGQIGWQSNNVIKYFEVSSPSWRFYWFFVFSPWHLHVVSSWERSSQSYDIEILNLLLFIQFIFWCLIEFCGLVRLHLFAISVFFSFPPIFGC